MRNNRLTYEHGKSSNVGTMLYEINWSAVHLSRHFTVDVIQVVDFRQRSLPPFIVTVRKSIPVKEDVARFDEAMHAEVAQVVLDLERRVVRVAYVVNDIGYNEEPTFRSGNGASQETRLHSTSSHLLQHVGVAILRTVRVVVAQVMKSLAGSSTARTRWRLLKQQLFMLSSRPKAANYAR